ncbi:MAG: ABC transporter permease [Phycisphaerales bacterium]|jgi:ABC-type transport system involved in multi-copper enzyme maturation permease subunit|nr:ABC transporter permease [Phycisphaerales bacterium]
MPAFLRWFFDLGPTNPIAVRLVTSASRRARHHYIRIAYLGLLIIVLLWSLLIYASREDLTLQQLAAAGSTSFSIIAFLQIGLICILAPVFMAGAIAQEADPRTWDILLTTPLKATQIVLGNLLGRLFFILALLFSSLPLFAVTQYFGGVPGSTILASYFVAAGAALLVGAIAIALSVSRLVGKRAVFAFYVCVITYLAITFAVDRVFGAGGVTWMTALNPFLALMALMDPTGYPTGPLGTHSGPARWFLEHPVMTWCVLSVALSTLLIVISAVTVRIGGIAGAGGLIGRDGSSGKGALIDPSADKQDAGRAGTNRREGQHERHRGAKEVWRNPISWREAASINATLGRIILRWSFIAIGVIWALIVLWLYHNGTWNSTIFRQVLTATVVGELVVITLVAINMSATSVSREREDGTLDLLLTTPITPGQYLSGKLKGMVAWLLPLLSVPVISVLLAGIYAGFGGFGRADSAEVTGTIIQTFNNVWTPPGTPAPAAPAALPTVQVPVVLPEAGLVLALVAIPFVALCVIIGMQWSLRSKGTLGSVTATVALVGVIAGVVGLCAWQAASDFATLGPIAGALSPVTAAFSVIQPEHAMNATVLREGGINNAGGLGVARISLIVGAIIAALLHIAIVYAIHASMTRSFDFTVRKLAGLK